MGKHVVHSIIILSILGAAYWLVVGIGNRNPHIQSAKVTAGDVDASSLPNLVSVTDTIYSGGEPKGDQAFSQLESLGIRTIVSVDGARPNIELARKHGLRYVHIPIGYDGIPIDSQKMVLRLMQEAQSPLYIHCHHGKHRGPAAAAIACLAGDQLDHVEAMQYLGRAGTSKSYIGLWKDVESFSLTALDGELPPLVETADVGSLASAMAKLDRAFDNLALCRDAGWQTPDHHPDLVPEHEALMLREGLVESKRGVSGEAVSGFATAMDASLSLVATLEDVLSTGSSIEEKTQAFDQLSNSCKDCHVRYRNTVD